MNRATRDKFASGTQKDLTSGNACWQTAPAVFDQLCHDFGGPFDVDLTADASNHLCDVWFGPGSPHHTDALTAPWRTFGSRGYSNPPYGPFVARILPKAKAEAANGFTSLFLLPLRVTEAFRWYVLRGASDLILTKKRLVFFEQGAPRCSYDRHGRPRADCAMFDSMLVRYVPGWTGRPRLSEWKVPPHVTPDMIDRWAAAHPFKEWQAQQKARRAA
jgi:hypothetical protein